MKVLTQFLQRNQTKIINTFNNQSKQDELPATSVFTFLRFIFQRETIRFFRNNKDYFSDDNNQSHTEKTIEQYYKSTPDGKSGKFYLYRINFNYDQVLQYLKYWLSTDSSIKVEDSLYVEQQNKNMLEISPESKIQLTIKNQSMGQSSILDNQFLGREQRIPILVEQYENAISKYQKMLKQVDTKSVDSQQIHQKIEMLQQKLKKISNRQTNEPTSLQNVSRQHSKRQSPKAKTQELSVKNKKQVNFKMIFDYYARQNQFTGVKASFDRIQHESQTINYQKLVHFLKQYQIFPQKSKNQKKLYNLFVKVCLNMKDLHYQQFLILLDKLPEIVIEQSQLSPEKKKEIMTNKILARNQKNKLFHNPFHSVEKQNFRIDSSDLKYQYKLKPINGKLENDISNQLQNRKKNKEQAKNLMLKEKQELQLKKLKKLMQIDPYHPLVVKNAKFLQAKTNSIMEPIASLDNMERFRDSKFDMKAQFGISDFQDDPLKQIFHRYQRNKRADLMQKQQSQKMNAIMSSMVERTQAKLVKLGISPKKRQVSSKMH